MDLLIAVVGNAVADAGFGTCYGWTLFKPSQLEDSG